MAGSSVQNETAAQERNFFEENFPEPAGEGMSMSLMELLTLLTVILSLLSLLLDAVRLTIEVTEKTSQSKNDDSKKD